MPNEVTMPVRHPLNLLYSIGRSMGVVGTLLLLLLVAASPARAEEPAQIQQMRSFVELMTGYYELIGTIHAVAADPEKTAVLEMTKLKEYLEQSGQRDRVPEVLRRIVSTSARPAVRNAATMMLAEALNERGEKRAAAEVLERALMDAAAAR